MPHVLLNGAFADADAQLEEFATDPFSSPEPILRRHFLDQSHGFCGYLWFRRCCSELVLPEQAKSLAMPPQERLWLDNEEGLFPGSNHSCQKQQELAVRFGTGRSFHVSAQDNKLLAQECVFCHEFGLASKKVGQRSQDKSGVGWFGPVDETVVERLKAKAYQTRDEGENLMHSVRYPFVKMRG